MAKKKICAKRRIRRKDSMSKGFVFPATDGSVPTEALVKSMEKVIGAQDEKAKERSKELLQ